MVVYARKGRERQGATLAQSRIAVIERFLYSNHLVSAEVVARIAPIVRTEGSLAESEIARGRGKEEWAAAVDWLKQELARAFEGQKPAGPGRVH